MTIDAADEPSDQLLHLDALGALVSEEPDRNSDDQRRARKEFEQMVSERSKMVLEIAALRREREHTAALLLETEQLLADVISAERTQHDLAVVRLSEQERLGAALAEQVERLQQDIAALRASTSWRVTAPLRAVTRLLGPTR